MRILYNERVAKRIILAYINMRKKSTVFEIIIVTFRTAMLVWASSLLCILVHHFAFYSSFATPTIFFLIDYLEHS
jgi:hypothetical protein